MSPTARHSPRMAAARILFFIEYAERVETQATRVSSAQAYGWLKQPAPGHQRPRLIRVHARADLARPAINRASAAVSRRATADCADYADQKRGAIRGWPFVGAPGEFELWQQDRNARLSICVHLRRSADNTCRAWLVAYCCIGRKGVRV